MKTFLTGDAAHDKMGLFSLSPPPPYMGAVDIELNERIDIFFCFYACLFYNMHIKPLLRGNKKGAIVRSNYSLIQKPQTGYTFCK